MDMLRVMWAKFIETDETLTDMNADDFAEEIVLTKEFNCLILWHLKTSDVMVPMKVWPRNASNDAIEHAVITSLDMIKKKASVKDKQKEGSA